MPGERGRQVGGHIRTSSHNLYNDKPGIFMNRKVVSELCSTNALGQRNNRQDTCKVSNDERSRIKSREVAWLGVRI